MRDVPFSALQFAFYEKFKVEARKWEARPDGQMSLHIETACGAVAGGLAGFLTTPLDVMKTLLQTQVKKPSSSVRFLHLDVAILLYSIRQSIRNQ